MAGSPTADHISRPMASVKPPTGFQAALERSRTPRCSLPFHGYSLSFTVRMKTGELRPLTES